jgi:hypothetical protein
MNPREAILLFVAACVVGGGCKYRWSDGPHNPPRLERKAQRAAKQEARIELDCQQLTPTTLSSGDTGTSKWYAVDVEGCGRTITFQVSCVHGICTAEK